MGDPLVHFAKFDDWEGLYVDGKLVAEGHSIRPEDVALALGKVVSTSYFAGEDALEKFGAHCPKTLSELGVRHG